MKPDKIRNLAIVAHVDHGKTTLVDQMLKQSGIFHENQIVQERVMDQSDLERERGITIMAKNTAIFYNSYKLNIVDTPGHADFGGEVERIVQMVDGVLLLVDAFEGPMPQTRFVLRKALDAGLAPIVVINKIDRLHARPLEVLDEVLELFIELEADDSQLDFPVIYTNARSGTSTTDLSLPGMDLKPLFEMIISKIPAFQGDPVAPLQMGVTMIDYDPYLGRQAVGRILRGTIRAKQELTVVTPKGLVQHQHPSGIFVFNGLKKVPVTEATTGDIVVVAGLDNINVGNTITDPGHPLPLDFVLVSEPTMAVSIHVNKSPFAGQEGQYVTSRKLGERLARELESDVSLRVEATSSPDTFIVSGRGELHLSVLIETMRREGYEFEISRPRVVERIIDGVRCEPIEELVIEVPEEYVGIVMERLGPRKSVLINMSHRADGRVRLEFHIPTRGLFGFRPEFMTDTRGLGIMNHLFHHYDRYQGRINTRTRGSLVAWETGTSTNHGLENAQERGEMFIGPGVPVYKGMIVGERSRPGDLIINVCKKKQLSNIRSSTSDIAVRLTPHRTMSLEQCMEFISDDELVEITPKSIRMRKNTG